MNDANPAAHTVEETPVEDVRRIRERLSAEFGNDVRALAEHAQRIAEAYRSQLGLEPPIEKSRSVGTS